MRRILLLSVATALLSVAISPLIPPGQGVLAAPGSPDIYETVLLPGYYEPFPMASGPWVVYDGDEGQAGEDLNGDGDKDDRVPHFVDMRTGSVYHTGLAVPFSMMGPGSSVGGSILSIAVEEDAQGLTDLNGDGDTDDLVHHVYDMSTRTAVNLGLASHPWWLELGDPAPDGGFVMLRVDEASQGEDLNTDGDMADIVVHVRDVGAGTTTNLAVAVEGSSLEVSEDIAVIEVDESKQGGTDLNGDGDAQDTVLHIYDSRTGAVTNLGVIGWSPHAARGSKAYLRVSENGVSSDLNGDGDTDDVVMHVFDAQAGSLTNLEMEAGLELTCSAELLAGFIEESTATGDLNGDGDTADNVMHLYQSGSSELQNTGFVGSPKGIGDGFVVFAVPESMQGATDLNGDGDVNDAVAHVWDLGSDTAANLGVRMGYGNDVASGNHAVVAVLEAGEEDLNSDLDRSDEVIHVYTHSSRTLENTGLAGTNEVVDTNLGAFVTDEASHGATDLNDDGDATDEVPHLIVFADGLIVNTMRAARSGSPTVTLGDGFATAVISEENDGRTDHSGDGDVEDDVAFAFEPKAPNVPPYARASGPYDGKVGVAMAFSSAGSSDSDGTIVQFNWDFGDGGGSLEPHPTHTYVAEGSYEVALYVTDDRGGWDSDHFYVWITARNVDPVSVANGPYVGKVGVDVSFSSAGSSDSDGTIVGYEWDFGDGGTSTEANPSYAYAAEGTYPVSLTVTDDDGATDTDTTWAEVVVGNVPPVAKAGGPYSGSAGVAVAFLSTGSVDPDGTIVGYMWTFGDGAFSTLEKPTHVYAAEGTYTVTLTVTDDDSATDSATTQAVIDPFNELPIAEANGPYRVELGELVHFSSDGSFDPDGSLRSYEWDFGDGATAAGVRNTVHFYSAVGVYTVTLKIIDDRGGSDTDTATVTITPAAEEPPHVGDTFVDDDDSVFEEDIEWMAAEGITKGCNPPTNDRYCPNLDVTRGQMAAFLVRALDLQAAPSAGFTDTVGTTFEQDIDRLAAAGITKGCNPPDNDRFCPDDRVRREVMAAFLVRALKYTDDGGGDLFTDDDGSIFESDIDKLATAEVTKGCNPPDNDRFCPTQNVTRGQMAAFLHRALEHNAPDVIRAALHPADARRR